MWHYRDKIHEISVFLFLVGSKCCLSSMSFGGVSHEFLFGFSSWGYKASVLRYPPRFFNSVIMACFFNLRGRHMLFNISDPRLGMARKPYLVVPIGFSTSVVMYCGLLINHCLGSLLFDHIGHI